MNPVGRLGFHVQSYSDSTFWICMMEMEVPGWAVGSYGNGCEGDGTENFAYGFEEGLGVA